jgi:hypothetical protein
MLMKLKAVQFIRVLFIDIFFHFQGTEEQQDHRTTKFDRMQRSETFVSN